ncbi:MAG: DNA (cytosine-5-)-methyltransferase [Bacteroidia bacterium]
MHSKKYTLFSLFSGCGGKSLGFHLTKRFNERIAIDCDAHSIETFNLNFGEGIIRNHYITPETGQFLLGETNMGVGEVDVLIASPPCPAWSILTAGKEPVDSPGRKLFYDTIDIIGYTLPKVFLIENVKGVKESFNHAAFAKVLRMLRELPYKFEVLKVDASYFAVPQKRERVFIYGVRNDLAETGIKIQCPEPDDTLRKDMSIHKLFKGNYIGQLTVRTPKKFIDSSCISGTLTATGGMQLIDKDVNMVMPSIRELMALSSFPDEFKFPGLPEDGDLKHIKGNKANNRHYNAASKRIGNCVPPELARRFALCIADMLDQYYAAVAPTNQ